MEQIHEKSAQHEIYLFEVAAVVSAEFRQKECPKDTQEHHQLHLDCIRFAPEYNPTPEPVWHPRKAVPLIA